MKPRQYSVTRGKVIACSWFDGQKYNCFFLCSIAKSPSTQTKMENLCGSKRRLVYVTHLKAFCQGWARICADTLTGIPGNMAMFCQTLGFHDLLLVLFLHWLMFILPQSLS